MLGVFIIAESVHKALEGEIGKGEACIVVRKHRAHGISIFVPDGGFSDTHINISVSDLEAVESRLVISATGLLVGHGSSGKSKGNK